MLAPPAFLSLPNPRSSYFLLSRFLFSQSLILSFILTQTDISVHTLLFSLDFNPDPTLSHSIIFLRNLIFFSSCFHSHLPFLAEISFLFFISSTHLPIPCNMNTSGFMGISTMKPCCRILICCRSSAFLRISSSKCPHSLIDSFSGRIFSSSRDPRSDRCRLRILPHLRPIDRKRRDFFSRSSNWRRSRVSSRGDRGILVISNVASDIRHMSTSVEPHVGGKSFEQIYVQGLGVKPLVIEKIESGAEREESSRLDASVDVNIDNLEEASAVSCQRRELSESEEEAWRLLRNAVVNYCGCPVGTVAANDPADKTPLNYDQVFIRDFVPSALAFLLKGESEIVRNFLLHTLQLQSWEKTVDCYSPGQGLMPASFKVRTVPLDGSNEAFEEILDPDFGESAIGRVAPVDSGLWWIILLRAYGKITGDYALQERVDVQTGIKLILNLCLSDGFDMFPSLLVTDGSCMIDRRMGIHGHPLEIQALFYSALRCSREMIIVNDGSKNLARAVNNRLSALSFHIREYYWVDMNKINEIYRYKTEEYSYDATNKFNIYPDQIPAWLVDWIPDKGGYLIGNLQPAHMDFRFFSLGNLWAIVSSLTTPQQAEGILNLIEAKWDDLIGKMPFKICYPALEYEEWRIITGSDPKNTPWSYHNGGSWPTLLWQFTLACIKMGRPDMAKRAVKVAEERLLNDKWPEYYDTRTGRFIGKQARLNQTWTIAGFLTSKMLLENPEMASILICEEDLELLAGCACMLSKSARKKCSRSAAKSQVVI